MRFVELFAGIGGFSLGFEKAGLECVGHVEIDGYAKRVLQKNWPKVPLLSDIREVRGDEFGEVDILCGGFPCQDISSAGKRAGIHGQRSGLFDEIIRITGVCSPRFIVLENVANLLSRPDWFGYVLARIASIGFDAEWDIISAAAIGAHHLRRRVWIVAYPNGSGFASNTNQQGKQLPAGTNRQSKIMAHSNEKRKPQPQRANQKERRRARDCCEDVGNTDGRQSLQQTDEVQSGWSAADNAGWWESEPNVGRVANGIPNRVDRVRCLGNALVPQIAEYIGKCLINATAADK